MPHHPKAGAVMDDNMVIAQAVYRDGLNRRYLQPADLRSLSHVSFSSRRAIEGLYAGKHRTTQRGHSIEFRDYRQYNPGDDVTRLDWKVLGRTDKLFIKLFEHQADLRVHLLIDASSSMAFRGLDHAGDSKYDISCRYAAAIGFLIARQRDRFSQAFAQGGLRGFSQVGNRMPHLIAILQKMESVIPSGAAQLAVAIDQLMRRAGKTDLLCLFSDLLDPADELLKCIGVWQRRGGHVIVFHALHDHELTLPDSPPATFIDSENHQRLRVEPQAIRREYQQRMQAFVDSWALYFQRLGIAYNLVRTTDSYLRVLHQYFASPGGRLTASHRDFTL